MKILKHIMKKKKGENLELASENIDKLVGFVDVKDGIVETTRGYFLLFEISPVNFSLQSEDEKEFITNSYESLLKVFKAPFRIFTIAKKSDAKEHIDYIKRLYKNETEENVKNMILEYEEYVKRESLQSGVNRKFVVCVPYSGIDTKDFSHIRSWLYQKQRIFKEGIGRCGNELIEYDDQKAKEIYFELLNRKSAEKERIERLYV